MKCTCTYNKLLEMGYKPKDIKHNKKCKKK